MVYIPGGTFKMGSESGDRDEKPVHDVTLDGFWMDEHEVTNDMYRKCVEAGACEDPNYRYVYDRNPNYPVVNVDWNKVKAYCEWTTGVSIGSTTVRLPTEAEWEYAARGGLEGKRYPWGDESPTYTPGASNGARYVGPSNGPINVKTFQPNGYGLFDMAGNVWEWVNDWHGMYLNGALENPTGPDLGIDRVVRGGSWYNNALDLRVSKRGYIFRGNSGNHVGFRCVRLSP